MKDFLNCYEKLDVDYSSLKLIYNKIGLINNDPSIVKRRAQTSIVINALKLRLNTVEDELLKLASLILQPYSSARDNKIQLDSTFILPLFSEMGGLYEFPDDEKRTEKFKSCIDKSINDFHHFLDLIRDVYSEEREDQIKSIFTDIGNNISELHAILDQPYIDEIHKSLIKNAVNESENRRFPVNLDIPLKKNAVLHNAYNIEETQELNSIYHINFMMPGDDNKLDCIQPNGFIRYNEDGQLYRITKKGMNHDDTDIMTVEAEHVITTLSNDVMYGSYTFGGDSVGTAKVINYILGFQKTKNWVLAGCDFDRRFSYTWKHETLLSALLSIPKEFGEDYMWDYDTTVYPWKLYLRKLDKNSLPKFYIRAKRNLISAEHTSDYSGIVTRVYALGYEDQDGVQLDISSVNSGIPYVEADPETIAKYGLISVVLIDRRFENAESLKAYAEAYLKNALEPGISRTFDVVDLYPITNTDIDNAYVGALTRLVGDGTNVFITKTTRVHDQPGNLNLELSTKSTTLVDQIADIANRVQINSVYS